MNDDKEVEDSLNTHLSTSSKKTKSEPGGSKKYQKDLDEMKIYILSMPYDLSRKH